MNTEITFGVPTDVGPNHLHTVVVRFPLTIRRISKGALKDIESQHHIDVEMSDTLMAIWRLNSEHNVLSNEPLIKTLFEYARSLLIEKLNLRDLQEYYQIDLNTGTVPKENPYDPGKIQNPIGFSFRFTIPEKLEVKERGGPNIPKVFISYSWDDDPHRAWVRELATRLRTNGVDVTLDQWHLAPGDQLPEFMEGAIRTNDFILIICTPRYKEKSDGRQGGVGFEEDIITAEVLTNRNHRKFIPILRNGAWAKAAPSWLSGKYRIDLSGEPYSDQQYTELLETIYNQRTQAPPLGVPPSLQSSYSSTPEPDEPVEITLSIKGDGCAQGPSHLAGKIYFKWWRELILHNDSSHLIRGIKLLRGFPKPWTMSREVPTRLEPDQKISIPFEAHLEEDHLLLLNRFGQHMQHHLGNAVFPSVVAKVILEFELVSENGKKLYQYSRFNEDGTIETEVASGRSSSG